MWPHSLLCISPQWTPQTPPQGNKTPQKIHFQPCHPNPVLHIYNNFKLSNPFSLPIYYSTTRVFSSKHCRKSDISVHLMVIPRTHLLSLGCFSEVLGRGAGMGMGGLVAQSSPAAPPWQWGDREWRLELTPWFNSGQLTHQSELVNNPRHLVRCPTVGTRQAQVAQSCQIFLLKRNNDLEPVGAFPSQCRGQCWDWVSLGDQPLGEFSGCNSL